MEATARCQAKCLSGGRRLCLVVCVGSDAQLRAQIDTRGGQGRANAAAAAGIHAILS
jgi:hypothetical protein